MLILNVFRNIQKLLFLLIIILLPTFFLAGCSNTVSSYPGWYTKHVEGTIQLMEKSKNSSIFILVRKHNRSFIETSKGPLDRVSVAIVHPENDGTYTVYFDDATGSLEILFIAKNHRSQSFRLSRTLGIGYYEANVELLVDRNWKNNFYFVIKPLFSDYITESRYRLPEHEKKFLGDWLTRAEAILEN